ncbi:Hypothetical predicted protein [Cloeon dipterum]|uniref:Reverse transcriptase domain-containing protein n=2 Tax=Cloeon dipterum TaxID=197152 RepID=A0A8S1E492_9INSE|nr:Hypothetical predicted protein [Cloeon dipterum]
MTQRVGKWERTVYSSEVSVVRGTPQGGVLSPSLLVGGVCDMLLYVLIGFTVNYADDTSSLISAADYEQLYQNARLSADMLQHFCEANFLVLNASKSVLVQFRGRKQNEYPQINLAGQIIPCAEQAKFLGLHVRQDIASGMTKYLGMQQLLQINSNDVRKLVEKKVLARVRKNRSEFVEVIQEKNLAFGALDLASVDLVEFPLMSLEDRKQEWRGKELHGRFLRVLESQNVDKEWSTEWLRTSGIFGETEGFILSIQDEVISTRGYQRHVMHQDVSDRCRLCRVQNESIQHVCGGCSVLAPREYLERHNNVAKVVHQALAKNLKLQEEEQPYYRCKPPQVMEAGAGGVRLLWDSEMVTDRAVEANRPDIVFIDQRKKEGLIIDIAVPLDANVERTVVEKKRKYQPLAVDLKEIYNLRKISVVPVVISTNGVVLKEWKKLMETLPLTTNHLKLMQKAAVLGTANIVRKTLAL